MTKCSLKPEAIAYLLEGLKTQLSLTGSDLDQRLEQCLRASLRNAEAFLGYKVAMSDVVQTEKYALQIPLLYSPVARVTGVLVTSGDFIASVEDYRIEDGVLFIGTDIPGMETVQVFYEAGMDPDEIDADILQAVFMRAASLFDHPADQVDQYQRASVNLLRPHRLWK